MSIESGKVRMLAEGGTFDELKFGEGLAELCEKLVPSLGDIVSGCGMVRTQQDVAFQEDLGVIPPSSAEQGVAQGIGTGEEERGGEPEGRNRVGWDVTADASCRGFHISVTCGDLVPVESSGILKSSVVLINGGEPGVYDSPWTM